ncbi:MAG TPA: hypothetical protein VN455_11225 [Methanotrichaceae archaeon]|nr:hypothetical protein [Methanotrichaceae archaeon]
MNPSDRLHRLAQAIQQEIDLYTCGDVCVHDAYVKLLAGWISEIEAARHEILPSDAEPARHLHTHILDEMKALGDRTETLEKAIQLIADSDGKISPDLSARVLALEHKMTVIEDRWWKDLNLQQLERSRAAGGQHPNCIPPNIKVHGPTSESPRYWEGLGWVGNRFVEPEGKRPEVLHTAIPDGFYIKPDGTAVYEAPDKRPETIRSRLAKCRESFASYKESLTEEGISVTRLHERTRIMMNDERDIAGLEWVEKLIEARISDLDAQIDGKMGDGKYAWEILGQKKALQELLGA